MMLLLLAIFIFQDTLWNNKQYLWNTGHLQSFRGAANVENCLTHCTRWFFFWSLLGAASTLGSHVSHFRGKERGSFQHRSQLKHMDVLLKNSTDGLIERKERREPDRQPGSRDCWLVWIGLNVGIIDEWIRSSYVTFENVHIYIFSCLMTTDSIGNVTHWPFNVETWGGGGGTDGGPLI